MNGTSAEQQKGGILNGRCYAVVAPEDGGPALFQHGNLVFQAHHVGWIVAGFFSLVASITSFWLVNKHLQWYTNKKEQRYIVRLLFLVPIYANISLASYLFWNHSTPLLLIRDMYESTVLTAFFYLLLTYISPDSNAQKLLFLKEGLSKQNDRERKRRGEKIQKWTFPLNFVKRKPEDGLYFLQIMKWGVLQYTFVRPATTLAAVTLNYLGLYCEESFGLGWGHIYITLIVSLSVSIAMYCLLQMYFPISAHLARHKPLLKLFAVKAVVFLTFWQATLLSVLSKLKLVKDTKYMTANDINIGIGALLETFEMMLFAFLHVKAFSYKPYRPFYDPSSDVPPPQRTPRLKSLGHAMNFGETFKEFRISLGYLWDQVKGKEVRADHGAIREQYLEGAFGRSRMSHKDQKTTRGRDRRMEKEDQLNSETGKAGGDSRPRMRDDSEEVDLGFGGERQWLGAGDEYGYGLESLRREKSDGLGLQIERELMTRGIEAGISNRGPVNNQEPKRRKSWWKNVYDKLSFSHPANLPLDENSGPLDDHPPPTLDRRGKSRSRPGHPSRSRDVDIDHQPWSQDYDYHFDDPPPVSGIHTYRNSHKQMWSSASAKGEGLPVAESPPKSLAFPMSSPSSPKIFVSHPQPHLSQSPDGVTAGIGGGYGNNPPALRPIPLSSHSPPLELCLPPGSSPQVPFECSDSLLERVFPYSDGSSQGHANSSQSLVSSGGPSSSGHAVSGMASTGHSLPPSSPKPNQRSGYTLHQQQLRTLHFAQERGLTGERYGVNISENAGLRGGGLQFVEGSMSPRSMEGEVGNVGMELPHNPGLDIQEELTPKSNRKGKEIGEIHQDEMGEQEPSSRSSHKRESAQHLAHLEQGKRRNGIANLAGVGSLSVGGRCPSSLVGGRVFSPSSSPPQLPPPSSRSRSGGSPSRSHSLSPCTIETLPAPGRSNRRHSYGRPETNTYPHEYSPKSSEADPSYPGGGRQREHRRVTADSGDFTRRPRTGGGFSGRNDMQIKRSQHSNELKYGDLRQLPQGISNVYEGLPGSRQHGARRRVSPSVIPVVPLPLDSSRYPTLANGRTEEHMYSSYAQGH